MEEAPLSVPEGKPSGKIYMDYVEVNPWARLISRILDYIIFISLVFFLSQTPFKLQLKEIYAYVLFLFCIVIWCPIEAVLLSLWGTTPGKWLCSVTVRDLEGNRLRFLPALRRSFSIWLLGIGAGIPVITFFELLMQYNHLKQQKITPWDKKKYTVAYNYPGGLRTTITVLILAGFFVHRIFIPQISLGLKASERIRNSLQSSLFSNTDNIADAYNQSGYTHMENGRYEEAKRDFLLGLDENPDIETKDALYNNLSWAYYNLGDYQEALRYSKAGLDLGGNDTYEYLNYANALYALGSISEAEQAYEKAVEAGGSNAYALYGLGQLRYERGEYSSAIDLFRQYTLKEKDDADGWSYLGLSYLYGDHNEPEAKKCLDKALELAPDNFSAIESMAEYYSYTDKPEEAEALYQKALEENHNDVDLTCRIAAFYHDQSKFDKAILYADRAIQTDPSKLEAYRIKAETQFGQGERQKAVETVEYMLVQSPQSPDAYYFAGNLYNNGYEYRLAVDAYDKSLELNPFNEDAVIGKIQALYYSKHYNDCLEFALASENTFDPIEIPWYIADIYSMQLNQEKALEYYKKALSKDATAPALNASIGWVYYYMEDLKNAEIYADKALELDESYYNATDLKKCIEKRKANIVDQVAEFIETNYMYYKPNPAYDAVKSRLQSGTSESIEDIRKLFGAAYQENDLFSFILDGKDYQAFLEVQSSRTVEHRSMDNHIEYIRITGFTRNTANEFLDIVDHIENSSEKVLVIDLRGNGGGDTTSGCDILDFLLPDSVVCNLIYKDGYSSPYYSDNDSIPFKHFFILTDEQTASCSELVTLGLKTYLNNVTVVGRKTFGKGVGQISFEDKSRGFILFLVNHYWNVREENISGKGIQPDIEVKGSTLEAYMAEVMKYCSSLE